MSGLDGLANHSMDIEFSLAGGASAQRSLLGATHSPAGPSAIMPGMPGGEEDDAFLLSSSAPGADGLSRNSRLARKAESARQARLRHKQFVTDLQDQAAGLQARINELEVHCTSGPGSAAVALRELKAALSAEQLEQLRGWLSEAQGDNHVLKKYENGAALPPPPSAPLALAGAHISGGSAPIAIGGGATHWRGGGAGHSVSPMESDEDAAFPLSRSWDDCEVARSILNLNSPNGFHPLAGNGAMPPPTSFSLPSSSAAPFGGRQGSSLLAPAPAGTSLFAPAGSGPPS